MSADLMQILGSTDHLSVQNESLMRRKCAGAFIKNVLFPLFDDRRTWTTLQWDDLIRQFKKSPYHNGYDFGLTDVLKVASSNLAISQSNNPRTIPQGLVLLVEQLREELHGRGESTFR